MAKSSSVNLLAFCLFTTALTIIASSTVVDAGVEENLSWVPSMRRQQCQGSIAECMGSSADDEFAMDTEISRRILATTQYISYGALQRNTVPCSRRGTSYYNCQSGGEANPYNRGCSAITRCRS
ncbi:protein RALF-like 33 [Juglans microcarpa x Juglans regia]|uniref:protein RALF-like 33 n=1 Tax=Juglans microcarpa x Juglans regia TaxID=2249226 RepID=UPI001B7E6200|nr:protein RALF-like 33 [Juglans microcarpa x Juglans regia]